MKVSFLSRVSRGRPYNDDTSTITTTKSNDTDIIIIIFIIIIVAVNIDIILIVTTIIISKIQMYNTGKQFIFILIFSTILTFEVPFVSVSSLFRRSARGAFISIFIIFPSLEVPGHHCDNVAVVISVVVVASNDIALIIIVVVGTGYRCC